MTDAIIVALITVAGTVICQLIISRRSSAKDEVERAVRQQKLDDTLASIGDRLDEHNNYAQKFGEINESVNEIKIGMTSMKKDIEYLRKGTSI